MAIRWPIQRRIAVDRILSAHPKDKPRCERVAEEIMPYAREQDPKATKWKISPKRGYGFRCLAPRVSVGEDPWYHHVFVEAEHHCVDSLTGVDGTLADDYLDEHFYHPECIYQVRIG